MDGKTLRCSKCDTRQPDDNFHRAIKNTKRRGRHFYCKDCISKLNKSYRASNPEKFAERDQSYDNNQRRFNRYGITKWDYEDLLEIQGNLCAICLNPLTDETHPHIDHDHNTNKVRGILCRDCNLGLGRFKDNIDFLQRAIDYLKASD